MVRAQVYQLGHLGDGDARIELCLDVIGNPFLLPTRKSAALRQFDRRAVEPDDLMAEHRAERLRIKIGTRIPDGARQCRRQ